MPQSGAVKFHARSLSGNVLQIGNTTMLRMTEGRASGLAWYNCSRTNIRSEGRKGHLDMKILVTGGAGFIGSNLVDGLLAAGHEVVVVDNLSSGKRENLNPQARFYELDICDPGLDEVFARERIDLVDHHAAQIDVRHSVADPQGDARTNILGLLNILENCRRYGVRGVVFASSGGVVYGEPSKLPATETFPKGPLSPYGVSKLASEFYLCYYAQVMNIPYVTLRYGNIYGPRQDPHGEAGVVAIFGQKLLRGRPR